MEVVNRLSRFCKTFVRDAACEAQKVIACFLIRVSPKIVKGCPFGERPQLDAGDCEEDCVKGYDENDKNSAGCIRIEVKEAVMESIFAAPGQTVAAERTGDPWFSFLDIGFLQSIVPAG